MSFKVLISLSIFILGFAIYVINVDAYRRPGYTYAETNPGNFAHFQLDDSKLPKEWIEGRRILMEGQEKRRLQLQKELAEEELEDNIKKLEEMMNPQKNFYVTRK